MGNIANYDWIFFPVSDRENPMDGDGGSHFSLVIYSKKEQRFFHFDPLRGLNRRSALDLMTNLLDSESVTNEDNLYKLPDFEEASCDKTKKWFRLWTLYIRIYGRGNCQYIGRKLT